MSGFRSRFPTVTPWTTDQDLPDIVFRPCFTPVVSELGRACSSGAATRLATQSGRPPEGRREPGPGRGGSGAGPVARVTCLTFPQVTDMAARRAGSSPARTVNRHIGDRPAVRATRRSHPLAFRGTRRVSSPSRPERHPTPPLISHIHPAGSDRAAGRAALHVTGTPRRQDGGLSRGVAGRICCAGSGFRTTNYLHDHPAGMAAGPVGQGAKRFPGWAG
jgi:hypothetical protein